MSAIQQQLLHNEESTFELNLAASASQQKMTISDLETKWKDVPDKYFITIAHILAGHINDSEEFDRFNGPMLKPSIKSLVWVFLIQYAALAILGVVMNIGIIVYILYHRLYKDVTQAFICNLALCHFIQCAIVLPITLMVMLIQNWIFGQFLCFFLPMLQDIPLHVAMISHIIIAWDRMRWLGDPLKGRLPAFVCCCATWLTGMVIALPYPIYTIYVEIGDYVPRLNGIGLCVVNLMDDMHEYMRGLFFIMYCGPSILLAYLYIRTSQELREPDGSFSVMMFENQTDTRNSQRRTSAKSMDRPYNGTMTTTTTTGIGSPLTTVRKHSNGNSLPGRLASRSTLSQSYDLYSAELDVCREKRKQRNFGTMAATQVVCLCPLMVLRMARLSMEETYENQKHLDFTYLMFVWIAFLPTIIFPCIYATQILPRVEQERLRGYFRLSTKRLQNARNKENGNSGKGQKSCSRGNSIEKDEITNTTQGESTSFVGAGEFDNTLKKGKKTGKQQFHYNNNAHNRKEHLHNEADTDMGKGHDKDGMRVKKNDVRVKIISDNYIKENRGSKERVKNNASMSGGQQLKLTVDSFDNNSFSNLTASTYCNGNSSLLDDGGLSNFGDGEDSSIVSGMILTNNSSNNAHGRRSSNLPRQKDDSNSELSSITRMDSSTTLERDLEIMDMLERRRSIDVQDPLEREQLGLGDSVRMGERRRLPDIHRVPKAKVEANFFDISTDTSITAQMLSTATACVSQHDPLTTDEAYSSGTTPNSQMSFTDEAPVITDEEVPQDFFDEYTPGSKGPKLPQVSQYTRRQSRKTPHFGNQIIGSHRSSKRDSFNSLNGSDLIAGAFGELDPTQPLTKMVESRMRRSGGRSANFSTTARSSMRSRDLNSTHTMHPELDFRENIFAEL